MGRNLTTSPIEASEAGKLLKIEDRRDKLLFACGLFLGLRCNEICKLRWKDILEEELAIHQSKTGKTRRMSSPVKFREIVEECYDGQDVEELVFVGRRGSTRKKGLVNKSVNDILRKYIASEGVKTRGAVSSHSLRKSMARAFYEANGRSADALAFLQAILQHSSITITLIYIGVQHDLMAERVNLISYG